MKKKLFSQKRPLPLFYSLCLMLCVNLGWGQTTVFTDDFNRGSGSSAALSAGGTPSVTYTTGTNSTALGTGSSGPSSYISPIARLNQQLSTDYAAQLLGGQTPSTTGTWSNSGTTMSVASASNILVGHGITAVGIPSNAVVTAISGTTITFSPAATQTAATNTAVVFGASVGSVYASAPIPVNAIFNPVLSSNTNDVIWTFNFKTNRTSSLSGFGGTSYAGAVILASTTGVLASGLTSPGAGYVVTLERGATTTSVLTINLKHMSAGLGTSNVGTTIIAGDATSPTTAPSWTSASTVQTIWIAVKVIYTGSTNTWQLWFRDDGTAASSDFTTGMTRLGAGVVNSTYTASTMTHFGYLWGHSTSSSPTSNTLLVDNFKITVNNPTINAPSVSSLSAFTATGSTNSAEQSFAISGQFLTNSIVATAPTGYEVSTTSGSGFGATATITNAATQTGTIYVRLKTGLSDGAKTGDITIASTGATTTSSYTVALSGTVASTPTLTPSTPSLTQFPNTAAGANSTSSSFTLSGVNLSSGNVTVTAPTNFSVSTDNSTFTSSVSITPSSGGVSSTIYVRYSPTGNGGYSGNVVIAWSGLSDQNVAVSGYLSTFYYKSGSLATAANWSGKADGTGTSVPTNFTTAGVTYQILSSSPITITTDAAWTVSGVASKIILGDSTQPAITLIVANTFPITGTINITAASSGSNSIIIGHITAPTFGTLDATSEVHYQISAPISATTTFGKVFFENNYSSGLSVPIIIQTSLNILSGSALTVNSTSYIYFNTNATATIAGTIKSSRATGMFLFSVASPNTTNQALQFQSAESVGTSLVLTGSTIEYSRGPSNTGQTITPRTDYSNLTISDGTTPASTSPFTNLKSVLSPITVSGSLTLNNAMGNNAIAGAANITLLSGATIVRTAGSLDAAPVFGSKVNVIYNGTNNGVAPTNVDIISGFEIPTASTVLNNLTISTTTQTVTLNSATNLNNKLTLTSGTLSTGGLLTLKSGDCCTSATVAQVTGGSVSGDVTVERYIPAGQRAYRLLSSPVTTTTFINANWQTGTHITGTGGNTNGFDTTTGNGSSMFTYNNSAPAWNAVPNTNATVLTAGVPYLTYIRGSKAASLTVVASNPPVSIVSDAATLSAKGTLKIGDVPITGLNETAGGFSAIGNPYQAQVDMAAVLSGVNATASNLDTGFYYVVDPSLGTKGAYLTVDVTAAASAHISKYLQPGQACFVKTTAAGPASLTFKEIHKSEVSGQTTIFRIKNTTPGSIDLTLSDVNANRLDVLKVTFDANGSNAVDDNDAAKLINFDESMATANEGKLLAIEKRAIPTDADEIPLNITKYRGTSYSIKAQGTGLTGSTPYLFDKYTGATTEIPQDGSVNYAYTIDVAIPASIAADRFKLIYAKTLKTIDNELAGFALYPNPSKSNSFSVVVPQSISKVSLRVSNLLGQQLYSQNDIQSGATVKVTVSDVKTSGVYLVSLSSEGKTTTTKWIVE